MRLLSATIILAVIPANVDLAVGVVVVAMIAIVSVAVVREYFGCVGQAA